MCDRCLDSVMAHPGYSHCPHCGAKAYSGCVCEYYASKHEWRKPRELRGGIKWCTWGNKHSGYDYWCPVHGGKDHIHPYYRQKRWFNFFEYNQAAAWRSSKAHSMWNARKLKREERLRSL